MKKIEIILWISLFIPFYAYFGYGIILYVMVLLKRLLKRDMKKPDPGYEPEVTLLIGAYNEKDYVQRKVENSLNLDYPAQKIRHLWVTDGSDDGTDKDLMKYNNITVLHQPERRGKIGAINRGMEYVKTPLVIFSDANAMLGRDAVRRIVNLFSDPKVGCVSGEKRISEGTHDGAAGSGEGIYWKYESTLKKWDSELYSVVGAAGELFAIRTELFQTVEPDTLLDDFMMSMRIAARGYTIKYDPEAYATETASANVKEELKRKIRIAAGGIQSIMRLLPLLNIFKYGILSFQYISHRVLRWTIAPLLLPVAFVLNFFLADVSLFYKVMFTGQVLFYVFAFAGWLFERYNIKITKILFVPYYFFIMNYAVYRGMIRLAMRKQSVNWERARRG